MRPTGQRHLPGELRASERVHKVRWLRSTSDITRPSRGSTGFLPSLGNSPRRLSREKMNEEVPDPDGKDEYEEEIESEASKANKVKIITLQQAKKAYTRTQIDESVMSTLGKGKRGRNFITWAKNIDDSDDVGLVAYYIALGQARAEATLKGEKAPIGMKLSRQIVKKAATAIGLYGYLALKTMHKIELVISS